jgi:hypothetical protein
MSYALTAVNFANAPEMIKGTTERLCQFFRARLIQERRWRATLIQGSFAIEIGLMASFYPAASSDGAFGIG